MRCAFFLAKGGKTLQESIVRFDNISMQFPGVLANDKVSFDIKKGEVFALVGENGAGKSTLMNILYGIHEPTDGAVDIKLKNSALRKLLPWVLEWYISILCWCRLLRWHRTS